MEHTMTDEQAHSIVGAVDSLGGKLISSVPAQFLALLLMNTVFILGLLFFLERETESRVQLEQRQTESKERLLMPLLNACITQGMNPAEHH